MKKALLIIAGLAGLALVLGYEEASLKVFPASPAFYDRNSTLYHVKLSQDEEWYLPVSLDEMGKWLPLVAVNAEDGRFFRHVGIDALSVMRAMFQNILRGKTVSGASTITTQVIRLSLSEPHGRKRDILTKWNELLQALMLERKLTKSEILERYLNLAPFGGNIRGVQAASMIYFGKNAGQVSAGEACLLIGMLKGPAIYRPDRHPQSARKRRDEIISLMERKKIFSHSTALKAKLEPLPGKKFAMPSRAWHFTRIAESRIADLARYDTALDIELQTKLEAILGEALRDVPQGVTFSAGISDNHSGEILAWVGNARFSPGESWIDCGRRGRSPGSTLKPFAYLSAIEQGILTPSTVIDDSPRGFGGLAPRNFDLTYRGAVTARVALHSSLNAPAARVLRMAGNERVLSLLRESGYRQITKGAGYYGDALILGGCEVTLLEQLEAYTMLGAMGIHRGLRAVKGEIFPEERAASAGGCWMLWEILRDDTLGAVRGNVAVKTGTSYGGRDAWACTWTRDYTVCVWCGKADGSAWEGLVGARICTPIARQVHTVLPSHGGMTAPPSVTRRRVCMLTGEAAGENCKSTKEDYELYGVSMTRPCRVHSGIGSPASRKNLHAGDAPSGTRIISPLRDARYINAPTGSDARILLKAEGSRGKLYWFIDGEYAGMSEGQAGMMREFGDGEHEVSVSEEGRVNEAETVKFVVVTPGKKAEGEKLF